VVARVFTRLLVAVAQNPVRAYGHDLRIVADEDPIDAPHGFVCVGRRETLSLERVKGVSAFVVLDSGREEGILEAFFDKDAVRQGSRLAIKVAGNYGRRVSVGGSYSFRLFEDQVVSLDAWAR